VVVVVIIGVFTWKNPLVWKNSCVAWIGLLRTRAVEATCKLKIIFNYVKGILIKYN
jgi:hypothetical protein